VALRGGDRPEPGQEAAVLDAGEKLELPELDRLEPAGRRQPGPELEEVLRGHRLQHVHLATSSRSMTCTRCTRGRASHVSWGPIPPGRAPGPGRTCRTHSSYTWCTVMNRSSSWAGGSDCGTASVSSSGTRRYPP